MLAEAVRNDGVLRTALDLEGGEEIVNFLARELETSETFAFPLRDVARAYAFLADPTGVPASDARSAVAEPLTRIRDAMLAYPEMVAGRHDRLDTSLMKAVPGRLVSKSGMEALRGVAMLAGPRRDPTRGRPDERTRSRTAMASIGTRAASVEARAVQDPRQPRCACSPDTTTPRSRSTRAVRAERSLPEHPWAN
jgi:hypothetical protein